VDYKSWITSRGLQVAAVSQLQTLMNSCWHRARSGKMETQYASESRVGLDSHPRRRQATKQMISGRSVSHLLPRAEEGRQTCNFPPLLATDLLPIILQGASTVALPWRGEAGHSQVAKPSAAWPIALQSLMIADQAYSSMHREHLALRSLAVLLDSGQDHQFTVLVT
jgi:hypothetical protein